MPLATVRSGANRTDMKQLAALLDAGVVEAPAAAGDAEPHRCWERGEDDDASRVAAAGRGYTAHSPPPRGTARPLPPPDDPARHPARRWVVEVCHRWYNRCRRLLPRWEKKASNDRGFVQLAAGLIVYRKLRHHRLLSG